MKKLVLWLQSHRILPIDNADGLHVCVGTSEHLRYSVLGDVDNAMMEQDSGPHTLHFASPPAVVEPLLPLADESRMSDDDEAISSLRAGPQEKNMEISTTPRWLFGIFIVRRLSVED